VTTWSVSQRGTSSAPSLRPHRARRVKISFGGKEAMVKFLVIESVSVYNKQKDSQTSASACKKSWPAEVIFGRRFSLTTEKTTRSMTYSDRDLHQLVTPG